MKPKKNHHKVNKALAVFVYTSVCCGKQANKPPVARSAEDKAENKYSTCSLGKWHCSQCGQNCKVKRTKYKEDTNGAKTGTEGSPEERTEA